MNITNAYKELGISDEVYNFGEKIIEELKDRFTKIDKTAEYNQCKVLSAMKKAYEIDEDVKPLADKLGSDTGYMLSGGYALISGRGEVVRPIESDTRLHFALIYAESGVNTAECYAKFDEMSADGMLSDNEKAISALQSDNFLSLCSCVNNALKAPAAKLNGEVKENLEIMRSLSPSAYGMTGSGSTVF